MISTTVRRTTEGPVLWKSLRSVALVGLAWLVVTSLPDVARYLRMRDM
jgi:hypothetical protein